jgi:hypothetical protein
MFSRYLATFCIKGIESPHKVMTYKPLDVTWNKNTYHSLGVEISNIFETRGPWAISLPWVTLAHIEI